MQDTSAKLEITELQSNRLLLRCSGGLSWEDRALLADQVERRLAGRTPCGGVVLDFSQVEFVNSAGIGAIFQLANRLRKYEGPLALAAVRPIFLRMFRLAGLERLALLEDSVESALRRLDESGGTWGLTRPS